MKGGKRDGIGIMAAGKRGMVRRWPFRNQVLPTSVPARKNNLSSQTSLPRMTGMARAGWEHLRAPQLAKKIFEEQNVAQNELSIWTTKKLGCPQDQNVGVVSLVTHLF